MPLPPGHPNRPGTTRANWDRDDIWHCGADNDHAAHPYKTIYWCPGGPFGAPGATKLPPFPDDRPRRATAAD